MSAQDNPYQHPEAELPIVSITSGRSLPSRIFLAFVSAFVLVLACSASLQGYHVDLIGLAAAAIGVAVFALPASVAAAFAFRRSDAGLILFAQLLTIFGLFAWFSARA